MPYTNSPLVDYVKISPNSTNPRNQPISVITIHHMAGNLSVESCGNVFATTDRQASSNYGIGSDGRVGICLGARKDHPQCWVRNKDNIHTAGYFITQHTRCIGQHTYELLVNLLIFLLLFLLL